MGLADFVDGEASDNDRYRDPSELPTNPIPQQDLSKRRIFSGAGEVAFCRDICEKRCPKRGVLVVSLW
jgi:hypothetical protein